jgi:hypothetical protein
MTTPQRETPVTESLSESSKIEHHQPTTVEEAVVADNAEGVSSETGEVLAPHAEPATKPLSETGKIEHQESASAEEDVVADSHAEPSETDPEVISNRYAIVRAQAEAAAANPLDNYLIQTLQTDSTESDPDLDSALGEDIPASSTTSLNSTVTSFRDLYGRRFHAFEESDYWLPNDEVEMNRLDLQHILCRITLGGRLHLAPIPNDLHRALDVGTGTGKWAIELAEAYPTCQVIGTDLSPIQPNVVPANCSFVVDNVEDEWVWNDGFDYIHSRFIFSGTFIAFSCSTVKLGKRNNAQCFRHKKLEKVLSECI